MFYKDIVFKTTILDNYGPTKIICENIEAKKTVLDIGCNSGVLANTLNAKYCQTDGVDINKKALKIAGKYCHKTYLRNLYNSKLNLNNKKYDYIVFSDILEHLPTPDLLLKDSIRYLKKGGFVWISLPNIARFEQRIYHLFGDFTYKPGVMSADHLRFFTHKTGIKLIKESGLEVVQEFYTGLGQKISIFPNLLSFQFVYKCKLRI